MCSRILLFIVHKVSDATASLRIAHMGWLRLVGSLKLQVAFAKEPYKRDDILQKRPVILRSLLLVATPYTVAGASLVFKVFQVALDAQC